MFHPRDPRCAVHVCTPVEGEGGQNQTGFRETGPTKELSVSDLSRRKSKIIYFFPEVEKKWMLSFSYFFYSLGIVFSLL